MTVAHALLVALSLLVGSAGPPAPPAPALPLHAPHDVVDVLGISPEFETDGTVFGAFVLTYHRVFGRSVDGGRSWDVLGPTMARLEITSFAFSPDFARDGLAFAGTRRGGVWRTSDKGLTWTPTGDPELIVNAVAVSPDFAHDGLVVVATESGCLRSVDGGTRWSSADSGLSDERIKVVAFGRSADVLYAGGERVHFSDDGGRDWEARGLPGKPGTGGVPLRALALDPADDDHLAVAFGAAGGGVSASTDGGKSFRAATFGLSDPVVNALAWADDGTLFAATSDAGCFRTASLSMPWTLHRQGLSPPNRQDDDHYRSVVTSPAFSRDGTVIVGAFEGVFVSHDRGLTWDQRETYRLRVHRLLELSPDFAADGTIFVGSYGGGLLAGRFADDAGDADDEAPGVTWSPRTDGIFHPFSSALAVSQTFAEDDTVYYGYMLLHRSRDRGVTWQRMNRPVPDLPVRALVTSPRLADDDTLYLGTQGGGTWRSTTGGEDWAPIFTDVPDEAWALGLAAPRGAPDTVFLATREHGLYVSDDRGTTARRLDLPDVEIRSFAVAPGYPDDAALAVGTLSRGLMLSLDGGRRWRSSTSGGDGAPLPSREAFAPPSVEAVAFSPAHATDRTVYAALSLGALVVTQDDGATWSDAGRGLSRLLPVRLALSPDFPNDRTLVLTNHEGLWISRDAGTSWRRPRGLVRVDDRHQSLRYEGAWTPTRRVSPLDFSYGVHESRRRGDATSLSFFGDSVSWYARRGPEFAARVRIELDGEPAGEADLFAEEVRYQERVFERRFASPGWHTLTIVNAGASAPGRAAVIHSDGFDYTH